MGPCKCFLLTIILSFTSLCYSVRNFYTAAVVEYLHIYADSPNELLKRNLDEYVKFMRHASEQHADIIVFPEYGLIDSETLYSAMQKRASELEKYTTYVPDPMKNIIPCKDLKYTNYKQYLVTLSCAARVYGIYTVINLPENAINSETGKMDFYNTNVVFDRTGAVIAKFRKINLSEEDFLTPGTEIVAFKTDFNVTFGIFTCFDLLFQHPALEVLSDSNVTDIIFTTAWYSETPFLQGLSFEHGYSKAEGVNMLASALQDPDSSDGGSAIFLSDGSIAEAFITNKLGSKILIKDVPIISKRGTSTCENFNRTTSKPVSKEITDIDNFPINQEDLSGYKYDSLKNYVTLNQICTDNGDFCCKFAVTVDNSSVQKPDYGHRLRIAIYKGLSNFGSNVLGGVRVCSLVACLNESVDSCGFRTNTSHKSTKFKSIEIQTIVDLTNDTHNQPSTLKADLMPITDYVYCETKTGESKIKIKMALTRPQDSLVTFGIYGRLYSIDTVGEEETELNTGVIIAIVCGSALLLVVIALFLWKYSKTTLC